MIIQMTLSADITVTDSNNFVLGFVVLRNGGNETLTSLTLDGVAGTIAGDFFFGAQEVACAWVYWLKADLPIAGTGTYQVIATWSNTPIDDSSISLFSFSGVDQLDPVGANNFCRCAF